MEDSLIKQELPELWNSYIKMAKGAMKEGALTAKVKEIIALSLSVAIKCQPCLEHHLKMAKEYGATRKEVAEAMGVVLLMLGGPSDVWTRKTVIKMLAVAE